MAFLDYDGLKHYNDIVDGRITELEKFHATVYGFHVNSQETDSAKSKKVTYLRDAEGKTPAKMNFSTGVFDWGSWADAFFIPKPCMLKNDGTVDYYLNPNNYALKEDGTASDISNESYAGNAMMEWGQNGKRIYVSIVPDEGDNTSYSVFIADMKMDDSYHCYSFYDKNDNLMEHFYTPIYSGSLDTNNKLRSLSGKSMMHSKSGTQEISSAKANGEGWNIEVWSDKLLMFFLLYLIGGSLDLQSTFGSGHSTGGSSAASLLTTGQLDDKGLFYGYSATDKKVKVFGMEDQWAEQWNRCCGLMLNNGEVFYKMTEGKADGSTVVGYPTGNTTGMISGGASLASNGYVSAMRVIDGKTIVPASVTGGSSDKYYCDYYYQNQEGVRFALVGGCCNDGLYCGLCVYLVGGVGLAYWSFGAALSCKPVKS